MVKLLGTSHCGNLVPSLNLRCVGRKNSVMETMTVITMRVQQTGAVAKEEASCQRFQG